MISQKSEFTEVKEIKIKEGEDCDFESNITCPYCGHQNIDSWESNDSEDEETCGRCGGVFSYQRDVEVTYSSSPVRAPEIKEYQLQGEKE
jgi:transcription elongation factor Elf1